MRQYKRAAAYSERFKTEPISPDDSRITEAVEKYKAQWKLPPTAHPAGESWFGVFDGEKCILVVGEKRLDGAVEITDMYAHPSASKREYVTAVYAMLNVYATALRRKLFKSLCCTTLARNETFQKAVERVFSVKPTAVVYMAEAS